MSKGTLTRLNRDATRLIEAMLRRQTTIDGLTVHQRADYKLLSSINETILAYGGELPAIPTDVLMYGSVESADPPTTT